MNKSNWIDKALDKKGYQGCKNCKYQPEPMRMCDWMEKQTMVHIICPRWELKKQK